MPQSKITIVGKLRLSEENGLQYSITFGKPEKEFWLVVEPKGAEEIAMGLGEYPKQPEKEPEPSIRKDREAWQRWSSAKRAAEEEWKRACAEYNQKLYADPPYTHAQITLLDL